MGQIPEKHRGILRHALGLDRGETAYRNRFVTGPGSADYDACQEMVDQGLMWRIEGNELTGGDPCFRVTASGIDAARG